MKRDFKADFGLVTADTLIKTGEGYLHNITLAYRGVTAGEFCTFVDGLDATGTDEVMIVFPAANGTFPKEWPEGKAFATGIFFNKGATVGSVWCEGQFR